MRFLTDMIKDANSLFVRIFSDNSYSAAKGNSCIFSKIAFLYSNCDNTCPGSEEKIQILIDDSNFEIFQAVLKEVLCVNSIFQGNNIIYNPGNDRAKEIAAKLMRGR